MCVTKAISADLALSSEPCRWEVAERPGSDKVRGCKASIDAKFEQIRIEAGERFDDLEFNAWLSVCQVTDDGDAVSQRLTARFGAPPEDVLASPLILVGTIEEMVDRLEQRRARWGYSYFVVQQQCVDDFAPVVARLTGR